MTPPFQLNLAKSVYYNYYYLYFLVRSSANFPPTVLLILGYGGPLSTDPIPLP